VLILPETSAAEAVGVAERLRITIQQQTFSAPMENTRITISMGIATYPTPGLRSIDDLIHAADEALYQAKESGRNRVISSIPSERNP
jgi:two-component system, cell cycle response regulator